MTTQHVPERVRRAWEVANEMQELLSSGVHGGSRSLVPVVTVYDYNEVIIQIGDIAVYNNQEFENNFDEAVGWLFPDGIPEDLQEIRDPTHIDRLFLTAEVCLLSYQTQLLNLVQIARAGLKELKKPETPTTEAQ